MPWYKAGTVSVVLNSNAVIGTGTAFIANGRVGDGFRGPDGGWYEVTNIASDTAMSISPNYQGATNGAGGYALAPLQGYVKDSADSLRALVNTYGAKLAALGTTGNYDVLPPSKGGTGITDLAPFAQGLLNDTDAAGARSTLVAAKSGANADITSLSGLTTALSIAQGGTGNATGTATKLAAAAILGSVSQSGGTPTGALMEYVSNATGEVWKFANGLMLTSQSISYPALSWTAGTGVRYLNVTASLPGGFAATPKLYAQLVDQDISTRSAWVTNVTAPTLSTLSAWLAATSGTTGAGAFVLNVHAIGRWY
ncbi:phage tail protein [Pseudomonas sp. ACM7]|uniref:phage tail protein n=1 Tax=Pseudomonas sp. ACM7 TaxID=2052956 RepID=UPI001010D5EF|nr:phage tail protein [Pseudomonas sp. ACM7]QAY93630.1 phage tail protein [Pseudomonas sp. ACM7]